MRGDTQGITIGAKPEQVLAFVGDGGCRGRARDLDHRGAVVVGQPGGEGRDARQQLLRQRLVRPPAGADEPRLPQRRSSRRSSADCRRSSGGAI
jgi:hypothetical protein